MKFKVLVATLFLVMNFDAMAQFSISLSGGYNIAADNATLGSYSSYNKNYQTVTDPVKGSFNKGFNSTLAIGYKLNKHLEVGIKANYLSGEKVFTNLPNTAPWGVDFKEVSSQNKALFLTPYFKYKIPVLSSKCTPYIALGIILPLISKEMQIQNWYGGDLIENHYYEKSLLKNQFNVGFSGAIGMSYKINKRIAFFSEINIQSLTQYTKTGTVKEFTIDGKDNLYAFSEFDKKTNYVKEITANSNTQSNPKVDYNQPQDVLRMKIPLSSIGVHLGMSIVF